MVDTTDPVVSAVVPADGSLTNDNTPTISFSVTETNLDVVELYVDGTKITSGLTNSDNDYTYTSSALTDGSHSFRINATDTAGNGFDDTYGFVVDTVNPVISAVVPADGSLTNDNTPMISFTVTDSNLDVVELYVDGTKITSGLTNVSADYTCTPTDVLDGDVLTEGSHSFKINATDSAGNELVVIRNFVVDTTDPVVSSIVPADGSATNDNTPTISFSVTETNLDVVELYVDGTKITSGLTNSDNDYTYTSSALTDGSHSFKINVTDEVGNGLVVSRNFVVDTVNPMISGVSPVDNSLTNDNTPTISFSVTETNLDVVELYFDGTKITSGLTNESVDYTYTPTDALTDGSHSFKINVTDVAGNEQVVRMNFVVDTTAPVISGVSPANESVVEDPTPTITFNVTEANLGVVLISAGEVSNVSLTGVGSGDEKSYTYTSGFLENGNHSFVILLMIVWVMRLV